MTLKITDELGFVYTWVCETTDEIQTIVDDWLKTLDETPLYSIEILF